MRFVLIAEGSTVWQRLKRHWGISCLIGENVLFDTFGDASVFSDRLSAMHINRAAIKHIILSHDHWDHTAGIWGFLARHRDVAVHICPGFGRETRERLASSGARIVEASGPMEISENVYTTGQIRGVYAGRDIFEQAVLIRTDRGLAMMTGCAHPGLITVVERAREMFPAERLVLVAGGFHLRKASRQTIEQLICALKSMGTQKVVPLHCTGAGAQRVFQREFGSGYVALCPGQGMAL